MDISALNTVEPCQKGAEMEIIDPKTGNPTGAFITVAGVDSYTYQKANDSVEETFMAKGMLATSPDERRDLTLQVLAKCTLSWRGLEKDGEEWPCTYDNAMTLYRSSPPVRAQVDAFISNRKNFLRD